MQRSTLLARALSTAALVATWLFAPSARGQGLDRPISEVWPARRNWDAGAEAEYSAFVTTLGRAIARGRCHTLSACLNNPQINPLHEAGAAPLAFRADCADVPYILRAYFAYRRGLPFTFAGAMRGDGRDPRYLSNARAEGLRSWTEYPTPRALFESIGDVVHSGYFRTAPDVEPSDFYQAAIRPGAIRPGTMYYDPNGHVLVVYEVRRNGDVLTFDGHPGGSLTSGRFDSSFVVSRAALGGGFKNFRPVVVRNGLLAQVGNAALPDFGGATPFDRAAYRVDGRRVGFHAWVRSSLHVRTTATHHRRRARTTVR